MRCRPRSGPRLLGMVFLLLAGLPLPGRAEPGFSPDIPRGLRPAVPQIAIIIDDMGRSEAEGERVIALPGPLACAFLPFEAYSHELAEQAHFAGKEVMLHQPMQTMAARPLDRGGMTLEMDKNSLRQQLLSNLARVPYVIGINNHMGSLLTQHPGHMAWVMELLKERGGLFFIDSRTTKKTVARQLAYENGLPSTSRDVFLDADNTEAGVREQWARLIRLAREQGSAIAIAHPHDYTLRVLEEKLARLDSARIRLVPVSALVQQQYVRDSSWRLSLSH